MCILFLMIWLTDVQIMSCKEECIPEDTTNVFSHNIFSSEVCLRTVSVHVLTRIPFVEI